MSTQTQKNQAHHAPHYDAEAMDVFGFWMYILTDCVLFATLFAGYVVLSPNVYGGPGIKELASLNYVLAETIFLLLSSFTYGIAMLAVYQGKKTQTLIWLFITFLLGLSFIGMEVNEFVHLYLEGHSWASSAALSAFFTLVGTHGFHVSMGLLWMLILIIQIMQRGLSPTLGKRLTYLGLFWHFLDIVWIFVFTIVYLMGAL